LDIRSRIAPALNAERQTANAERRTPNAERRTVNGERFNASYANN
jgi:hypothetical protein